MTTFETTEDRVRRRKAIKMTDKCLWCLRRCRWERRWRHAKAHKPKSKK